MATMTKPAEAEVETPRRFPLTRRHAWWAALALPLVLGPLWACLLGHLFPGHPLATWAGLVLVLLLAVCTGTDLCRRKIPNWATYPAFLWAVALNLLAAGLSAGQENGPTGLETMFPLGAVGVAECLLGAGVCLFVMLFVYIVAGGGAGDVKLAAAIGALLGLERGLNALVCGYIAAGVVIVSWLLWSIGPVRLVTSCARKAGATFLPRWVARPTAEQEALLRSPVPLAAFFAAGALAVLLGVTIPW